MSIWMILGTAVTILTILSLLILGAKVRKFPFLQKPAGGKGWIAFLVGLLISAALAAVLYFCIGMINMMICILHIAVIWLLSDAVGWIINRIRKKRRGHIYPAGICAIIFSLLYLGYGWYSAHHVVRTDYTVETDKDLDGEPLRIAMLADSHVGATFHSGEFAGYVKEIEAAEPDVLVIVGDFIDDDTTKEDMVECCEALGSISVKDGIYFVYGNHDRGYYPPSYRGYDGNDLVAELEKNGVTILQDETLLLDDRYYLIGREDAQRPGRAGMEELLTEPDPDRYMVVLDHEPHDYEAQEQSGVDLVLSGHTHGGWLFPATVISQYTGTDDKVYGIEKRSDTTFIVTSGISDWNLKFKTGCIAEWVMVTVE